MSPVNLFGATKILKPRSDKAASALEGLQNQNTIRGVRGLTRTDKKLMAEGGVTTYLYNVSPIFSWPRQIQGRSSLIIPKRAKDGLVSVAVEIPPYIVRDFDKGNSTRQQMLEDGTVIAEDMLGCSKEYPGLERNNLTNYGCFMTTKPLQDLPENEQVELLDEANRKHDEMCHQMVLEADGLHGAGHGAWITEMFRLCALHVKEDRPWVSKRGKSAPTSECEFCGYENKRGIAKCSNCKEVIDEELYAALKAKSKKVKKADKPE